MRLAIGAGFVRVARNRQTGTVSAMSRSFANGEGGTMQTDGEQRYALALGQAVIKSWGELPQDIQQRLFESAVVAGHHSERDESLREQLALFLHRRHPRTER
jgi:hypothetical protein